MNEFVFNVTGLTAQDRAQWEKDNLESLKENNYFDWSEEDKQRAFSDASFKNRYKDREDYNTMKSLSPELRDSIFNMNIAEDQSYEEALASSAEQSAVYESVMNYAKGHKNTKNMVDEFDKIASSISPYYKRYIGQDYLPWGDEDKVKKYAEYLSLVETTQDFEYATKKLAEDIQNTVAKNQSTTDAYMKGANGFGYSFLGSVLSGAWLLPSMILSIPRTILEGDSNPETQDLRWWGKYWHNVIKNPTMEAVNDWTTTGGVKGKGLWSGNYEGLSEEERWNRNEIIRSVEDQESNLKYIWDPKFIPEIMNTAGYSAGAAVTGKLYSSIVGASIGAIGNNIAKGAKTAEEINKANQALIKLAETEKALQAYVVPGIIGTTEGITNALETYNAALPEYMDLAKNMFDAQVEETKEYLKQNPNKAKEMGFTALTEEALDIEVRQTLSPYMEDFQRKAYEEASEAMLTNFAINSFINGFANYTLKAPMFGGRVKGALEKTKIGRLFMSDSPRFTYANGKISANLPSFWKRTFNTMKETGGEFGEEYGQSISDSFAQGWGESSMENFMARRLGGESYEAIADDLSSDLGAAFIAAGKSAVSKESFRAGIMGAFSQGLGNVTYNAQAAQQIKLNNKEIKAIKDKVAKGEITEKEGKKKIASLQAKNVIDGVRTLYRNPFIEQEVEYKANKTSEERAAEEINKWLQEDGNIDRFNSVNGAASFIKSMNEHNESGDEFSYQNSKTGKLINDAMMVHALKGTSLYDSYLQQFMNIINTEEGTENAAAILKASGKKTLQEAKNDAQKMLDNISKVENELTQLEEVLGTHVDDEVKKALVFGKMNLEDWDSRISTLESQINTGSVILKSEEDIAKGLKGNRGRIRIDELQEQREKLHKEWETLKHNESILSKDQKRELKEKKKSLDNLTEQIKELIENEGSNVILSSREILSLSPVDRYFMLNPANRKYYSKEQLKIIDNTIHERTLEDPNFMSKVEDSARLVEARKEYLSSYNLALRDPGNLNKLAYQLRAKAAYDIKKKQYAQLNDVTDEKEFLSRFEEELDKAVKERNSLAIRLLQNTVKDNPFYKKAIETEEASEDFDKRLASNETYINMEDKEAKQVEIAKKFLDSKRLNPKEAESLSALTENNGADFEAFIEEWNANHENPEEQVQYDNIGEVISSFQKAYDSLIDEEQEQEVLKEKPKEKQENSTVEQPKPEVVEQEVEGIPSSESNISKAVSIFIEAMQNDPVWSTKTAELKEIESLAKQLVDANPSYTAQQIADLLNNTKTSSAISEALKAKLVSYLKGNEFTVKEIERKAITKLESTNNSATLELKLPKDVEGSNSILKEFYSKYGIEDYLKSHSISTKESIYFVYDPSIISAETTSEEDIPLVLVVQDENGSYEIDGKKYQPIGIYDGNEPIKSNILSRRKSDSKHIIPDVGTTINGYIRSNSPEHTPYNTPIALIAFMDEVTDEQRVEFALDESGNKRRRKEREIKDKILSKIRISTKGTDEDPHLAYIDTDNKGGESEVGVFITDPENTVTNEGKIFEEVLKTGSDAEILSYNSRINGVEDVFGIKSKGYGFANALRLFFENLPFKGVNNDSKKLSSIIDDLNDSLQKYLRLSNGYSFSLEPTGNYISEGVPTYYLKVIGPNTIEEDTFGNKKSVEYTHVLGEVYDGTITDKEIVDIIKNLFLNEEGKFRKVPYINKKDEIIDTPLVKWNVDFNSFEGGAQSNTSGAAVHRSEIYDDNILEVSKNSLKRQISGVSVNARIIEKKTPIEASTSISNSDNATTPSTGNNTRGAEVDSDTGIVLSGTPEKIEDTKKEETKEAVKKVIEGAKRLRRSTDEKFYTNGVKSSLRVTSLTGKDIEENNTGKVGLLEASQKIGNSVDKFIRDIFAGNITDSNIESIEYPNIASGDLKSLYESLKPIVNAFKANNYTVISQVHYSDTDIDGVRTRGKIQIKDKKGTIYEEDAAGTLDLLVYNENTGKFEIIDIKTVRSEDSIQNNTEYWGRQLLMYKTFLEEEYGIEITSTKIMPIKVEYPNVDYTVKEEQLFIGDKAFKGAKPTLLRYLDIDTSKIDKVIKLESLSKETQDYILNKNKSPQESKDAQPQKPAETKRTTLPQRGIKRSTIRHRNIDAELEMRPEDSYREGTERNSLSKYPFNSLYKNILTEDEYNNLAEYVNGMAKQPLTKEYWDSLSEEEKEKHIKCAKGN